MRTSLSIPAFLTLTASLYASPELIQDALAPVAADASVMMLQEEEAPRAYLGVTIVEADGTVRVAEVMPDTAAAHAGLEAGDRLLVLQGSSIESFQDLKNALSNHGAGDEVVVMVLRDGEEQKIDVALGAYPEERRVFLTDADGKFPAQLEKAMELREKAESKAQKKLSKKLRKHLESMHKDLDRSMEGLHESLRSLREEAWRFPS